MAFVSLTWKTACAGMLSSKAVSQFSLYLQRCMNIWLMSHGLWRNLITVLLYKGSSFTVNTAAKGVCDTQALFGSNCRLGSKCLSYKGRHFWEVLRAHFNRLWSLTMISPPSPCGKKSAIWCELWRTFFVLGFQQLIGRPNIWTGSNRVFLELVSGNERGISPSSPVVPCSNSRTTQLGWSAFRSSWIVKKEGIHPRLSTHDSNSSLMSTTFASHMLLLPGLSTLTPIHLFIQLSYPVFLPFLHQWLFYTI